jgi:hypothetical protein
MIFSPSQKKPFRMMRNPVKVIRNDGAAIMSGYHIFVPQFPFFG